jgi:hypothetical protein
MLDLMINSAARSHFDRKLRLILSLHDNHFIIERPDEGMRRRKRRRRNYWRRRCETARYRLRLRLRPSDTPPPTTEAAAEEGGSDLGNTPELLLPPSLLPPLPSQ